jgi:soluble lytic murein transglycosylase
VAGHWTVVKKLPACVAVLTAGLAVVVASCSGKEGNATVPGNPSAGFGEPPVTAADSTARAIVLRARAFDRADNLDSARILYEEAARAAPEVRDWLYLRAAGVARMKADRDRLLEEIELPAAQVRRGTTEAIAIERSGDVPGAIAAYTAIGDRFAAIRLRMLKPDDTVAMAEARKALIAFVGSASGGQDVRDAIALFDRTYKPATAAEQLVLARGAYASGVAGRAASGYSRAFAAGLGNSRDHFNAGLMLARLNRDREAMAEYAKVSQPASLAAAARYQRARAMLALGRREDARTALRQITTAHPSDTSAASALLLLADLATDDNRDAAARSAFQSLATRYPQTRHAPAALFRAGLIAYVAGDFRTAANELDSVFTLHPRADDALAAGYWAGRAWKARGDTAAANTRWRRLLEREPASYYSVKSAARLGIPLLADTSKNNRYPSVPDVDAAMRRIALLRDFGMETELRFEQDALYRDAGEDPERLVATAHALVGTDQSSRSITLGRRAVSEVGPSAQHYRLVYPALVRESLIEHSKANGLDPAMVASLIRQESNFNPRATSPVGARGLMQLMPSVGRTLARSLGLQGYSDDSLYDPAINIRLGTRHLSGLFRRTANLERVLAAYNAGESRVTRWIRKEGASDPEMFTERIPFVETRDYVRAIIRNRAFYNALYDW